MKEFIKKNKFNIAIMCLYSLITLILIFFHENWRDEAQSWLIARDLSFIDIIKQMAYEGHPCLWYLIIAPFAKLGFPYITQNIISWIIMNISAIILLKKAPFDKVIKTLILFSAPFIYLFPVISRSYCLIPLAIFLIAATYKKRREEPIKYILSIILLAYTHVIMFGLVGALLFAFFFKELILNFKEKTNIEKKKIIISLIIAILGLLLLFIQLYPSITTNTDINNNFEFDSSIFIITLNIIMNIIGNIFNTNNVIIILVILILSVLLFIYELIYYRANAIIMLISISYQVFIYVFIYGISLQRVMTIFLIILFFCWIQREDYKPKKRFNIIFDVALFITLFCLVISGITLSVEEIKGNFSYAKDAAEYINNNLDNDCIFIASDQPRVSAIIAYTKENYFWTPQTNNYFTFVTWDDNYEKSYNIEEILEMIDNDFTNKDNIYFIYCYNWNEEFLNNFLEVTDAEEIYRTGEDPIKSDEKYIIYKLYAS